MLDWIKTVDRLLVEQYAEPSLRQTRSVPLSLIEAHIKELLQDSTLHLLSSEKGWVKKESLSSSQKKCYTVYLSPLKNPVFLFLEESALLSYAMGTTITASFAEEISTAFTTYFLIEILHKIESSKSLAPLHLRLESEKTTLVEESYLQFSFTLSGKKGQLAADLFLSSPFKEEWNQYFLHEPPLPWSEAQKEQLSVELGIQLGQSELPLKELKGLKEGDFLLLDRCFYDPKTKKGSVLLTLRDQPIFRVKLKEGVATLADYPPYEEVPMIDKNDMEKEEDEDFFDDFDDEDFSLEEDEEEEAEVVEKKEKEAASAASLAKQTESSHPPEVSLDEVEVNVVVEICRLRMSAKELLALTKGSVLNVELPMEQPVDLVVQGKRFGQAELMRVGDHVGVRVLQLVGK